MCDANSREYGKKGGGGCEKKEEPSAKEEPRRGRVEESLGRLVGGPADADSGSVGHHAHACAAEGSRANILDNPG